VPVVPERGVLDTLPAPVVQSAILLLGQVSEPIAAARVFPNAEPLDATEISIRLTDPAPTVESILVYDDDKVFLGRASLDPSDSLGRTYRLSMRNGSFVVPHREERSVYVRALVKAKDNGGTSGAEVRVDRIVVSGDGSWSNTEYNEQTTDTFPTFETARARITSIQNVGAAAGILVGGTQQIASIKFRGEESDSAADLRITGLTFQIEKSTGIDLVNVNVHVEGSDTQTSCSVSSSTVTCGSIPAINGSIGTGEITLRVTGEVIIGGGLSKGFLGLTLVEGGSPSDAGSITWTDGTTTFNWVPFETPVVRGTLWSF
jgi:hypothetical protein